MEREDDSGLSDDKDLWRRISPHWIIREGDRFRPGSNSFRDGRSGELSVFVAEMTNEDEVMKGHDADSLVAIPAGLPRSLGCIVALTPEDPNPAHRIIIHPEKNGMKKASKVLAEEARWVRLLPPPTAM
jgi:hypothetical protein